MPTRKVRYKKLNSRTLLSVLCEDQIDPSEYESLTTESQIATGVDAQEENVSWSSPLPCSQHTHHGGPCTTTITARDLQLCLPAD